MTPDLQPYVAVDAERGIVNVRLTGDINLPIRNRIRAAVWDQCRSAGLRRVLVDVRDCNTKMTTTDLVEFGEGFARVPHLRIALVARFDDEDNRFLVTVILNSGGVAKDFTDRKPAVAWLCRE